MFALITTHREAKKQIETCRREKPEKAKKKPDKCPAKVLKVSETKVNLTKPPEGNTQETQWEETSS